MKATIKINGQEKEVELTDEQVREFGFAVSKGWRPKEGETYYYLDTTGGQLSNIWSNCAINKCHYNIGNFYQSLEEAIFEEICQIYLTKYKRWLENRNEPIDWGNYRQEKWYAYYDYGANKIFFRPECFCQVQGTLYATSKQALQDFIEEIGKDNFIKYILKVRTKS